MSLYCRFIEVKGCGLNGRVSNTYVLSIIMSKPTHPALATAYHGLFPGTKLLEHEADQSPLSNVGDKNALSFPSTPSYAFLAWCSDTDTSAPIVS
jgi:hypothetical protein